MTPQRYQRIVSVLRRRQVDLTVVLEGVHKSHNLSAVQRTCDAIGIHEIHAIAPQRPYRAHKPTASGSAKWVKVHSHATTVDAIRILRGSGFRIAAAHPSDKAVDFRDLDYTQPMAILLGTERYGVSDAALAEADDEVRVPMHGMVTSLNVSVAAAVILYEAECQRRREGMYDAAQLDAARYHSTVFEWSYPRLAARYRALNIGYPAIGPEGEILEPVPESIRRKI
jgi:tRNA (guanosine-2'-O-)-methyltransferase